ncbi:MAG: ABC transporter permease [Williamsia sp.]|nr:ABC transporter permease [Williamsia sp.]
MMLGVVLQPLMFVLLFSYVFGDALGGDRYREFLIGGIMTQTVAFNSAFTALGLATDLGTGIVERFLALPMSRLAIVAGRTISDLTVNVVGLTVMTLAGLTVGWRIEAGFWFAVGAYATALVFGFALSWIGAVIGIVAASAEAAQSLLLTVLFPISFVSSAFIPSRLLPIPLRQIATWNPVTAVARSFRQGFGNPISVNPLFGEPVTWASQHAQLYTMVCSGIILAVGLPLTARVLRRR